MAVTRDKAARGAYGKAAATAFEGVNIPNQIGGLISKDREPTIVEQASRTLYSVANHRFRLASIMTRLRGNVPENACATGSDTFDEPPVLDRLSHARNAAENDLSDIEGMLAELEDLLCRE